MTVDYADNNSKLSKDYSKSGKGKIYFTLENKNISILKIDGEMFWNPIDPPLDDVSDKIKKEKALSVNKNIKYSKRAKAYREYIHRTSQPGRLKYQQEEER